MKEIEKILKKVEEGAAAGSETDKPKIIRRVISKETKKYCVLCSSPELRDIETGVFDHFLSPFPNNDEYMEEIKFCCNDINDELSSLRAQKIKMFKDSITTDELMVHLKEHKSKRKKIHLFDKFKPGHDIRKRLVVCNHFKGSSSSLTPRVGDVVTVKVGDEVDSQEGIVIKKIDVKKEDSDMSDDSDSDDSSILDSPDHEYLVAFTNRESEVFDSGSIRPYRSTVISNVKSVFQEFYADIKKNPGELPDPEGEQDITFGGHHEKTYYMSKKQFCLALTNGLTMLRKKDWSFSCHKKYLEFLHDTMYELECIYMTKPLCEEIHKEIRNMKSEKITIHGLGKLGALLNETPPNLTILRQVLSRADLDNDGMLSLSDFVRFSGRPLLEQYSNTMQYGREKKATEKGGGMPSLLLAVTQTQDKDTDRNDSLTYQQFPETQAEILVRLRRSYGTYVPTSKTSVLFSLTDAQRFATGLKQILVDEDKSEQFILDFQHKFDMHSDMSPGVITNRKKALYARCKALGVMYGWCHPSVWEYEHNLELYQEMARAQMEMESRGRVG